MRVLCACLLFYFIFLGGHEGGGGSSIYLLLTTRSLHEDCVADGQGAGGGEISGVF